MFMFTVMQLKNYFKTSRKHFTEGIKIIEASGADAKVKLSPKKEFVRDRMAYLKPFVSRRNTGRQSHSVSNILCDRLQVSLQYSSLVSVCSNYLIDKCQCVPIVLLGW